MDDTTGTGRQTGSAARSPAGITPAGGASAGDTMVQALAAGESLHDDGPEIDGPARERASVVRRRAVLDHALLAERADRIMATQSPVFFATRPAHGDPTRTPIYLVGPASPTAKRVRTILSAHSRIHAARPLNLIPALISCLEDWDHASGRNRVFPESLEGITTDDSLKVADWLLKRLQREDPGADHILDGFGLDAGLVGLVHLIFPKAPLILCLDDGRDPAGPVPPPTAVPLSPVLTAPVAAPVAAPAVVDGADDGGALWRAQARLIAHWRVVLPGRLHVIARADLLSDPRGVTRDLFSYLGLALEERVIQAITAPVDRPPPAGGENGLAAAVAHVRAGRLDQAEAVLQAILRRTPDHPAALHLMGLVCHRRGDSRRAVGLLRRSLTLVGTPMPDWEHNLAVVEQALSSRGEAAAPPSAPPPGEAV